MLDYQYFKDHYRLIAVDLSKQKELDADPRAIQQTEFYEKLGTYSPVCTVLEKSKETEETKEQQKCCKNIKMFEYNTVNAKLSNSQLSKLKSAIINKQGTTLRMNARMFNGNNLPHELLLTTRQTTKLRNAIENNLQTDIKLSKAQTSKIIQPGRFLDKILGPLLKTRFPLLKSVIKPLGLWGLTAASSAITAGVQKKIYGSGKTTLVISNDIMKIVQALEDSNILLKGVTKTIKNETKEQKGGFLSMLLGTLGASLLGDLLTKSLSVKRTARAGEEFLKAGKGIKKSINATTSFNKL